MTFTEKLEEIVKDKRIREEDIVSTILSLIKESRPEMPYYETPEDMHPEDAARIILDEWSTAMDLDEINRPNNNLGE